MKYLNLSTLGVISLLFLTNFQLGGWIRVSTSAASASRRRRGGPA